MSERRDSSGQTAYAMNRRDGSAKSIVEASPASALG